MSEASVITKTTLPADQLPILPETRPIEPIVQCGVLYLGTAPTGAGLHGLESIQEPLSHRYPVDSTNTVRGIDAILSVYDNGIQLTFPRQPHAVIFFPMTSLIYCASLRFSIIENDQTKPASNVDWRFMPLDTLTNNENKHPPLFCAVVQRTQILPGNECHCFITKSTDAAIAFVRTISQVYANLMPGFQCLKSPIFYQLDRFGRKLSEITGIIYISPANEDDSQLNRTKSNRLTDETMTRNYLFDPSFDGFFYRTDATLIEQWQLWDDDDHLIRSRPRPPASPFGLHEGLYHDDTTHEIQRYLRHMDDEEHSCSCSSSSKISTSISSISTEYSQRQNRHRSNRQEPIDDTDQFNSSFSNLQTSSFEPVLPQNNFQTKKTRQPPIIIEKVVPKPVSSIPILNPKLPQLPFDLCNSLQESNRNYTPSSDCASISYQINEQGEKITKHGNRIVFMDVVQMNTNQNQIDSQSYKPSKSRPRSHRQRSSKHIPVLDIQSLERLFDEKNSKKQRRTSTQIDNKSKDHPHNTNHVAASDKLEIIDRYLEDYHGNKMKFNDHSVQTILDQLESSSTKKQREKGSIISSTNSSKSEPHYRRNPSTLTVGPSLNYVERPTIPSLTKSQLSSNYKHHSPIPPVLSNEKINEYVSNIYGTARSIKSTSSSISHQQKSKPLENTAVINAAYISAFRYMQSSMNRNLFREYRNAY